MSNYKLFSLVAAVFLVTAAVSGGSTLAVLSDGASVTTTITVGNSPTGSINVTAKMSDPPTAVGNAPAQPIGNDDSPGPPADSGDGAPSASERGDESQGSLPTAAGDITIALEPVEQTITDGENTTYKVVVRGATDGVGSYDMRFELSDRSVASFENFTYRRDPAIRKISTDSGTIDVSGSWTDPVEGADKITIGVLKVAGEAGGETDVRIVQSGPHAATVSNGSIALYHVSETHNGTLKVTDNSNEGNSNSGNGNGNGNGNNGNGNN